MVLGFRVSYYDGAGGSTGSSRAPMCPCSACWEGLPHGTKAMNSWRKDKKQQQQQKANDSPSSSTSSLASMLSEKASSSRDPKKKRTLASRLTRRPSTESFASDLVPLRGAMTCQSTAETLVSCGDRDSFLDEKI